ncbi:MAG: cysteine hydrolase [Desulfobacteraceae bacterium]|nr:cysteine hydrolase [Desulfobacteraceae bacterium]
MASRALIVIDLLNDFLNPGGALYCGDESRKIVPVIRELIDEFDSRNDPVIFLRDAHARDDKEFELFPPHAIKGTWGFEVIPELAPAGKHHVVDKTRFSGFFGNNLADLLSELRPDEVWVTGVLTSICVMDTTGDLRNRGYLAVIPVEAVADIDPAQHESALERMRKIYGARIVHTRSRQAKGS